MTGSEQSDSERPAGFYSDPVDGDGNVIAHVTMGPLRCSWLRDPIPMVKVPHGEIVLPDEEGSCS